MKPQIPKYSPYWVDGMKVTPEHFIAWEDAQLYRQQQTLAFSRSAYDYGLSYLEDNYRQPVQLSGGRISVAPCAGVTKGGFPFYLPPYPGKEVPPLQLEKLDLTDKEWYVVLKINLYQRQAVGMPDPQELPPRGTPRDPHTIPTFSLREAIAGPSGLSLSANEIVLGRLVKKDTEEVMLDPDYIPPCLRVSVHNDLKNALDACVRDLKSTLEAAESIIEKIHNPQNNHKEELSQPLLYLSERLIFPCIQAIHQYEMWVEEMAPIHFFSHVVLLSRTITSALECRPEREKGELQLINYFVSSGVLGTDDAQFIKRGIHHQDEKSLFTPYRTSDALNLVKHYIMTLTKLYRGLDAEKHYTWNKITKREINWKRRNTHT